ncbi:GntR family transcriptional regulator [Rhizobium sp. NRK18]|uniref:GntR family transcriptional regulator n=1 Tax=Rhizobium sp. NRK18 TaxID=2964667 RepID=UPI0021C47FA8|nr:GntR family transcriptional regulator [Rhizobium sp. NRK18]MCQ2002538.1 GntR family transcriptional regulator [Rhizobium sp. NRK18]
MNDKETLAQKAYQSIKTHILEAGFASDQILTERNLAAASGISRTPLRSAISRLEKEGVVERLDNGALVVRRVSVEQLLEIVQMRRLLEGAAAARAAERGMTERLRSARDLMQGYADGKDAAFDDFWAHDDDFHTAVVEAAGLHLLPDMIKEMRAIARRCTITRVHDRFADQAREHIAVIDAIEAGNPGEAQSAMETHFDSVRARFLAWLAGQ